MWMSEQLLIELIVPSTVERRDHHSFELLLVRLNFPSKVELERSLSELVLIELIVLSTAGLEKLLGTHAYVG